MFDKNAEKKAFPFLATTDSIFDRILVRDEKNAFFVSKKRKIRCHFRIFHGISIFEEIC